MVLRLKNYHTCLVLPPYRQLFLIASSILYCADIFTDFWVAIETCFVREQYGLGATMMVFVILPLIYANYLALRNRYVRTKWRSSKHANIFTIDKTLIKSSPFRRSLFPYQWDSVTHVILNMLCFLQLGVLIDVMEMLTHQPQVLKVVAEQYSHYTYIRRVEVYL